jgi:hypothetical protein
MATVKYWDTTIGDYRLIEIGGGGAGGAVDGGYRGQWDPSTAYSAGDTVLYSSVLWGAPAAIAAGQPAPAPAPSNIPNAADNAADVPPIIVSTTGETVASGAFSNSAFTTEAGEPAAHAYSAKKSGWLKYTPLDSGTVTFHTEGSTNDTLLGMYRWTGGTSPFSFASLMYETHDDDSGADATSMITRSIAGGSTYYFQIGGYDNRTMDYRFTVVNARATAPPVGGWTMMAGPPIAAGGAADQVLTKNSAADYDTKWVDIPSITVGTTAPSDPAVNAIWIDVS